MCCLHIITLYTASFFEYNSKSECSWYPKAYNAYLQKIKNCYRFYGIGDTNVIRLAFYEMQIAASIPKDADFPQPYGPLMNAMNLCAIISTISNTNST